MNSSSFVSILWYNDTFTIHSMNSDSQGTLLSVFWILSLFCWLLFCEFVPFFDILEFRFSAFLGLLCTFLQCFLYQALQYQTHSLHNLCTMAVNTNLKILHFSPAKKIFCLFWLDLLSCGPTAQYSTVSPLSLVLLTVQLYTLMFTLWNNILEKDLRNGPQLNSQVTFLIFCFHLKAKVWEFKWGKIKVCTPNTVKTLTSTPQRITWTFRNTAVHTPMIMTASVYNIQFVWFGVALSSHSAPGRWKWHFPRQMLNLSAQTGEVLLLLSRKRLFLHVQNNFLLTSSVYL